MNIRDIFRVFLKTKPLFESHSLVLSLPSIHSFPSPFQNALHTTSLSASFTVIVLYTFVGLEVSIGSVVMINDKFADCRPPQPYPQP